MKKYIITVLTILFFIALSITGYFVYGNIKENESNSIEKLKEKCMSEIEYIEDNIILIMNEANNISYTSYQIVNEEIEASNSGEEATSSEEGDSKQENSNNSSRNEEKNTITFSNMSDTDNILDKDETDKIDWDNIEVRVRNMYSTWTSIMIDLSTLNVNRDNLLKFNSILDEISKNIEDKNKENMLIQLADLYKLLPEYTIDFYDDNSVIDILNVKSNILYSYAEIERDDWNKASNYIKQAQKDFTNILNNQINNINKIDIVNKAYVLINELEQDCSSKERRVFLINYANLMEELQNL